jgi:hypothetical protein
MCVVMYGQLTGRGATGDAISWRETKTYASGGHQLGGALRQTQRHSRIGRATDKGKRSRSFNCILFRVYGLGFRV